MTHGRYLGWMSVFTTLEGGSALHFERQQWLLASRGRRDQSKRKGIYILSWTVPLDTNAFGLKIVPETFQCAMDVILSPGKGQFFLIYLVHIIVFPLSPCDHTKDVRRALSVLGYAGVILELKKCCFFTVMIDYLGHVIPLCQLQTAAHMTDAMKRLKLPTNISKPLSFQLKRNLKRSTEANLALSQQSA